VTCSPQTPKRLAFIINLPLLVSQVSTLCHFVLRTNRISVYSGSLRMHGQAFPEPLNGDSAYCIHAPPECAVPSRATTTCGALRSYKLTQMTRGANRLAARLYERLRTPTSSFR
jgi:hypothetical protein